MGYGRIGLIAKNRDASIPQITPPRATSAEREYPTILIHGEVLTPT
jgi:hypothetical protein